MAKKQKGVWDISIEINGEQVKNNLNSVGKAVGQLNRDLKKLQPGTDEFIKKTAELKKARERYKEIKDEINDTNTSLEEAQGHFSNLFSGLLTGDIKAIQSGLQGISGNIKGMTKAALAFIATPFGLAITGLAGIALATKEWINFNEAAKEANITTQEIINVTGEELNNARIRAEALSEIFTKSNFEENLETAKALVKGFAISYDEAFDLIEASYVKGATANKEFNDSIIEFSAIQEKAGFTAKQTVDIINTAYEQGLYKDKLIDSIKEVDTALTEQTNSTKEALENAFGKTFTDSLFTGIETGVISTKDAIALMAEEAETAHLNEQQYAQLTADVFKAAGEDIAGAEKVLSVYNIALNKQAALLTPLQKETKRLSDAHLEMKQAQDAALKSDSYAKFSNDITIIWTKTKTFFYKYINGLVQQFQYWFLEMKLGISDLKISFNSIPIKFNETKKLLINASLQIVKAFGFIGDAWSSLKKLDFDGVKTSFNNFTTSVKETATNTFNEYDSIGNKIDEIQEKARQSIISEHFGSIKAAGDLQNNQNNATNTEPNQNEEDARAKRQSIFDNLVQEQKDNVAKEIEVSLNAEIEKLNGVEDAEKKKLKIRETFSKAKEKLDKESVKIEQGINNQRAQGYADLFGGIVSLLGKNTAAGKAAAIAQATMNTYQGVTEVWSTKSVLPEPFATISRIANTGIVLASGFKSVNAIKNTKEQGFYQGGFTGDTPIRYDDQDGVAFDSPKGPFHIKEWVMPRIMTENPKYAANLSYLEQERKMLTKGYFNGGSTATNSNTSTSFDAISTSENPVNSNDAMLIQVLSKNNQFLEFLITNGVTAVFSNDLRNAKLMQEQLDDYQKLINKNIR